MDSHLFSAVDNILGEGESPDGGASDDRVVSRRRVGHLHRAKLQERLAQGHSTQDELSAEDYLVKFDNFAILLVLCLV